MEQRRDSKLTRLVQPIVYGSAQLFVHRLETFLRWSELSKKMCLTNMFKIVVHGKRIKYKHIIMSSIVWDAVATRKLLPTVHRINTMYRNEHQLRRGVVRILHRTL